MSLAGFSGSPGMSVIALADTYNLGLGGVKQFLNGGLVLTLEQLAKIMGKMAAYAMFFSKATRGKSCIPVGVLTALACAGLVLSAPRSIREVDFHNFDYIFFRDEIAGVPTKLTWLPPKGSVIPIRGGR